ncbi:Ig-like domain repeat protein [Methanosarcina mazei]|jgi:hypothetical protein|uniref:PEF-CTERM protein sorting domain-containing protein n=1 Tax=Methanosarcina mazei TaxID=2209 RepID=A0A0F8K928_METMZ|nr:Ig-like domain repeat protein [Methanosarcina mazei]KKG75432.1 hypothetical protein DU46_13985 [Methanosarcina mazei]KKG77440.1 hypothetical protein DU61_03870 [Methanosarcina mazei]KKH06674.1 hypothetical protein DU51_02650 [Methanosarcina mazei]KKH07814.1 hypothetical protein DU62_03095 [Methanosarcina mazei]
MKYKICLGVVLVLIFMANTASAEIFFSNAQMSSLPNPSVEGQPITLTIKINVYDDQTGEVFPSTGGRVYFTDSSGAHVIKSADVYNGIASTTVYDEYRLSELIIGANTIIADYEWADDNVYIHGDIASVNQEILPFVKSCQVTASPNPIEEQPVTFTAKFDYEEGEIVNEPWINVYFYDDLGNYYGDTYVENGIASITVPSLSSGTHHITAHYEVPVGWRYSVGDSTIDLQVDSTTKVPEFPSIVVPIVAILGFIAVFSRKKE